MHFKQVAKLVYKLLRPQTRCWLAPRSSKISGAQMPLGLFNNSGLVHQNFKWLSFGNLRYAGTIFSKNCMQAVPQGVQIKSSHCSADLRSLSTALPKFTQLLDLKHWQSKSTKYSESYPLIASAFCCCPEQLTFGNVTALSQAWYK